jgi:palmitoyl-protein thioesterase
MLEFMELIKEIHPGIFIHSVFILEDLNKDKEAGFVRQLYVTKRAC